MARDDRRAAEAMLALLETEHAAIQGGDFADLEQLALDKSDLLARLESAEPPAPEVLGRLRAAAARNARALEAAGRGLRAARRRITELVNAGSGRESYDARGRRVTPDAAAGRLERRA